MAKKKKDELAKGNPVTSTEFMVNSCSNTALTIMRTGIKWCVNSEPEPDVLDIATALKDRAEQIMSSDLCLIQKTLANQAVLMEIMANKYLIKMSQSEYINQTEAYAKIAFKAQDQSRKTLTALAEIKNPRRTAFIKQLQMNQFNNNQSQEKSKNSSENENELNKKQLKEGEQYATLDIGRQNSAKPIMHGEQTLA